MSAPGLGHSKIWMLPSWHPLHMAGVWHDLCYDIRKDGKLDWPDYQKLNEVDWREASLASKQPVSDRADKGFLVRAINLSETRWQRLQAKFFYKIVRVWGRFRW